MAFLYLFCILLHDTIQLNKGEKLRKRQCEIKEKRTDSVIQLLTLLIIILCKRNLRMTFIQ